ncbi:HAD family hydrolase [Oscillospiraceae bacterium 50-16]|nr:HAD family hydrolase [Lawsonibacter sp.]
MYQNVIFDLDGTLLNTIDDLADAGNWVCRNHGWPTHTVEEYKRYVGSGMARLAVRFSPEEWHTEEGVQKILDEFLPYYAAHKEDKTAPYPGVPELLEHLRAAGVSIAVLSNKAHALAVPVIEGYFPQKFQYIQGGVEGLPLKPDPALLLKLMENMGATQENTLFVGDSDVDIRTAKHAGVTSCGVLWGFRGREELEREGADLLASSAKELETLILS